MESNVWGPLGDDRETFLIFGFPAYSAVPLWDRSQNLFPDRSGYGRVSHSEQMIFHFIPHVTNRWGKWPLRAPGNQGTERREIGMNWSEWQLLVIIDGALFARILSCFDSLRTVIFTSVKKLLCFKSKALIKANILYWYLNSMCLCWTLFLNRWPFIKQYIKRVSVAHEKLFWNVRAFDKYCMFIRDKSIQTPREHHYREQKESDFTSPLSTPKQHKYYDI